MTEQQIQAGNIAIAEFCGWVVVYDHFSVFGDKPCIHKAVLIDPERKEHSGITWAECLGALPNYHSSLDAMHEAEKHLKPLKHNCDHCAEVCDYERNLCAIVGADASHKWSGDSFKIAHATAPQRFEALLRAIGKWAL